MDVFKVKKHRPPSSAVSAVSAVSAMPKHETSPDPRSFQSWAEALQVASRSPTPWWTPEQVASVARGPPRSVTDICKSFAPNPDWVRLHSLVQAYVLTEQKVFLCQHVIYHMESTVFPRPVGPWPEVDFAATASVPSRPVPAPAPGLTWDALAEEEIAPQKLSVQLWVQRRRLFPQAQVPVTFTDVLAAVSTGASTVPYRRQPWLLRVTPVPSLTDVLEPRFSTPNQLPQWIQDLEADYASLRAVYAQYRRVALQKWQHLFRLLWDDLLPRQHPWTSEEGHEWLHRIQQVQPLTSLKSSPRYAWCESEVSYV